MELKKKIKQAQGNLDRQARAHYDTLAIDEIKECVIEHKWFVALYARMAGEAESIGRRLGRQLRALAEQYQNTLSELSADVNDYQNKVNEHLQQMGFVDK